MRMCSCDTETDVCRFYCGETVGRQWHEIGKKVLATKRNDRIPQFKIGEF